LFNVDGAQTWRLAAELDASGNPIRTYRYWPGIDQPHSMVPWVNGQKGTVQFYALDLPSRNVRGLFNASSAVTARYHYGPFGEPQGATGTSQPLRFAARELDATAGLYYVRARWYDAGMGRFISEDPIGLAGGINNYAYAANDPVNLSDPTGLWACPPGVVCLPPVTVRARSNGMGAAFLIDRWSGTRNGDGVASMNGVAYAASAGWQDGPGNCDKVTSEGCPFVLEPLVVAVHGNLYHRSCRFLACAAVNAHYRRNLHNVSAPSLDAALRPGSGCVLQSDFASQYHRYGPGNKNNMKFLCGGGHYESVFRGDTLVTDCQNGGTYNYGVTFPRHFVYDMVPYYFLGNC
jgi:RHS repeat-associated protein